MNTQRFGFFICALCLHLGLFWLPWQQGPFEFGSPGGIGSAEAAVPVMAVVFVADGKTASESSPALATIASVEHTPPSESQTSKMREPPIASVPFAATTKSNEVRGYIPSGLLSRLPSPLSEIDLEALAFEHQVAGQLDLTLLIDANGTVADVVSFANDEQLRDFSERVAAHFKSARFTPGEINGIAVKSQLKITVVSENHAESEN